MPKRNLNDFTPIEEGTQSSFVSEENTRKHIGNNPDRLHCRRYHVDGYILKSQDGNKCDYLLVNDDGKDAYFIEMKGGEIDDAPKQLEASIEALKDSLKGYYFFQRIVCSKAGTHKMNGSVILQWKRKYNGKHHGQQIAIIKEAQLTDLMVR